ncbi:unnamed protein product [Ceutorhynchus assimilis]|uniref:UDP-glucuronosyltransferase n=1 Tax=Ceutorhynchus assimilis TaxID=467358 RepID=A0A9N9MPM2_9CUCU|nr:unnamed protein product [Ceutorhynchus assimilis]
MLIKAIFLVATALSCTESYKILGIFPMPGISHYILASKLMKGLSEAGHDITMVSPYALKDLPKNGTFTDVVLDGMADDYFQITLKHVNRFEGDSKGHIASLNMILNRFIKIANDTLHHPKMKQLVDSDQKFDAVVMEQFFNDAHKVYAHIFDCPLILLSSIGPNSMVNPTVGNPQPVSYVPHLIAGDISKNLSLYNRAKNLYLYIEEFLFIRVFTHPKHDQIIHDIYPNSPALSQLYKNVSLLLLNSHISLNGPQPMVPNMVEIGGYFIDPPQKLPQDLQEYMDNAPEGVIYFSMGSNLESKDLPETKKRAILNVLGKLNQKVIWKFEEDLPGKPSNVLIRKWCPQQDILAHPNIKLFITHGGLLSTTEAIYHGVPVLAIPVFADQPMNAARAAADGYGLKLSYHDPDFNEETLTSLINELLTNSKYAETAKRKASLYHDRTMKPMETAVYWVEYVIRHKGATHLRVAGLNLPWYKYFLVDIVGSFVASFLLVLYIVKRIIKTVFCKTKIVGRMNKEKKN